MATDYKSEQVTNIDAVPQVKVQANEKGKIHTQYFSFSVPGGSIVSQNDTVELLRLPKGARLLGGLIKGEAMAGSSTASIGDGTTADLYLSAGDVSSAFNLDFAHTYALKYGEVLAAATSLVLTMAGAAWTTTAAKAIRGHVNYIID